MKLILLNVFVLSLVLILNCSDAITSEEIVAKLECVQYCHSNFHRSCIEVPKQCGNCILDYYESGGVCTKMSEGRHGVIYDPNVVNHKFPVYNNGIKKAVVMGEDEEGSVGRPERLPRNSDEHYWDVFIITILCSVSVILVAAIFLVIVCVCRAKSNKLGLEMPYQTFYGATTKAPVHPAANGDRKLAYSAQMYHYQYQKQQMLSNEKVNGFDGKNPSGNSTDDEIVDDDDTVYECPGLANTEGEMEVANPYFMDTPPANPPANQPSNPPANQPAIPSTKQP